MRHKRLQRSRTDRMISGVCGGLAEYFSIDPVIVRVTVAIILIATGILPIALVYLAMIFIVPLEAKHKNTKSERSDIIDV